MLLTSFIIFIFCLCVESQPRYCLHDQELIQCVTTILNKYFNEERKITYVNINCDDDEFLKTIHSTNAFTLISRKLPKQSFIPNLGYLITAENLTAFTEHFDDLLRDPTWNPYARFLIFIKLLRKDQLRNVFDKLLKRHVINVLVIEGTDEAHLYTYNPFDNYACGKYYNEVITFGRCSEATQNLYPNKLVTKLRNCTFRATLAHRPPLSIDPTKADDIRLGHEEYIFNTLSEKEGFKVVYDYSYDGELFSTVAPNMTAIGPMRKLQTNETDVIFGGMMMITSRIEGFSFLCGYHDFNDELRFAVKSASLVPIWKSVYIEFETTVWVLLFLSFVIYSTMMIILLRAKDKSYIVLELLDNLLLHSRAVRCNMTLKCILIIWVWFAYLINTFYQSNLFSITMDPSREYQISEEEDVIKYNLKPCFTPALLKFLSTETVNTTEYIEEVREECNEMIKAISTVSKNEDMFTLVPNYIYLFNKQNFNDKWGEPLIYYFEKPYAKLLFGMYFYKGFPITEELQLNAMRMRDNGLADKQMGDIYYTRSLKHKFSQKEFQARFSPPWCVYITGIVISTFSFFFEIATGKNRLNPS